MIISFFRNEKLNDRQITPGNAFSLNGSMSWGIVVHSFFDTSVNHMLPRKSFNMAFSTPRILVNVYITCSGIKCQFCKMIIFLHPEWDELSLICRPTANRHQIWAQWLVWIVAQSWSWSYGPKPGKPATSFPANLPEVSSHPRNRQTSLLNVNENILPLLFSLYVKLHRGTGRQFSTPGLWSNSY